MNERKGIHGRVEWTAFMVWILMTVLLLHLLDYISSVSFFSVLFFAFFLGFFLVLLAVLFWELRYPHSWHFPFPQISSPSLSVYFTSMPMLLFLCLGFIYLLDFPVDEFMYLLDLDMTRYE